MARIKHTGDGFVILTKDAKSRKGVLLLARHLVGGGGSVNHTLVYTRPEQLGDYLAFRVEVTQSLARLAFYFAHLFGGGPVSFYVGGAEAQIGRGNAGTPTRDGQGRTVYNGSDAAHTRLGSFSVNGRPVCLEWPDRVFTMAARKGVGHKEVEGLMPANGRLAAAAAVLDARTDLTDAMFNRVFGKIEDFCHVAMRGNLVPAGDLSTESALKSAVDVLNRRCAIVLVKAMKHYCKKRLGEIAGNPAGEQMQQAVSAHGYRAMFVSEGEMLRALVAEFDNPGGDMWQRLEGSAARAANDTSEELLLVRAAAEEIAAA